VTPARGNITLSGDDRRTTRPSISNSRAGVFEGTG